MGDKQGPVCNDTNSNCGDYCAIFTNPALRRKFGYDVDTATCTCHDIVARDVKAICTKVIERFVPIPGVDGSVGCRGERAIEGTPVLDSCRVFCSQETLKTEGPDKCLVVHNVVGLEFVLKLDTFSQPVYMVVRELINENCRHKDFVSFPDGGGFTRDGFKDLVKFIDGSCKTLAIKRCEIAGGGLNPCIHVRLRLVDKLWKHENLLVSALKPYAPNITVCSEFNSAHQIGPCQDTPPCPGPADNNAP